MPIPYMLFLSIPNFELPNIRNNSCRLAVKNFKTVLELDNDKDSYQNEVSLRFVHKYENEKHKKESDK